MPSSSSSAANMPPADA
jgi:hypothetical protein